VNLRQASIWASEYLKKDITPSNISYLVQYGRVKKHVLEESTYVSLSDLEDYYQHHVGDKEKNGNQNWEMI